MSPPAPAPKGSAAPLLLLLRLRALWRLPLLLLLRPLLRLRLLSRLLLFPRDRLLLGPGLLPHALLLASPRLTLSLGLLACGVLELSPCLLLTPSLGLARAVRFALSLPGLLSSESGPFFVPLAFALCRRLPLARDLFVVRACLGLTSGLGLALIVRLALSLLGLQLLQPGATFALTALPRGHLLARRLFALRADTKHLGLAPRFGFGPGLTSACRLAPGSLRALAHPLPLPSEL